jgi:hypothetical protein
MKISLFHCMIMFVNVATYAQQNFQLHSPDNKILIEIITNPGLAYTVFADGKKVVNESVVDMTLSHGQSLTLDKKILKTNERLVRETIIAQIQIFFIPVLKNYIHTKKWIV